MEWPREKVCKLIDLYREKKVLWDPTVTNFKNRNKKHDAWDEIAANVQMDRKEVEKKIRKMIGQFQRELKKGKNGDGLDASYNTRWAYFHMLFFLKDKNEPQLQTETEVGVSSHQRVEYSTAEEFSDVTVIKEELEDSCGTENQSVLNYSLTYEQYRPNHNRSSNSKRPKNTEDTMTEETYAAKKQLHAKNEECERKDDLDLLGEYVVSSLRKIRNKSLLIDAKFEISKILYETEKRDQQMSWHASSSE